MTVTKSMRPAILVALLSGVTLISGCSGRGGVDGPTDTAYVARDVESLYSAAKTRLDRGDLRVAAGLFDEVERQHPYSPWARRAQLMSAFAYYADREYGAAVQSARRFLSIHPGNSDAPYAYYLIGMSYYEQISDVERDQGITLQALAALTELQRRYPRSEYAADARLKIDLLRDHLAGKEMEIGRYYQRSGQWLASQLRFQNVIKNFQTTSHSAEALYRLTESSLALGLRDEALRYSSVLGANYPGDEWYEKAYELMEDHAPDLASAG